jgi:hypothetical protein
MTTIVIDIETIPDQSPDAIDKLRADAQEEIDAIKAPANYKDADKIADYIAGKRAEIEAGIEDKWRKTSFDGALGHICVIGMAVDGGEPVAIYSHEYGNPLAERNMLAQFFEAVELAGSRALSGGTRSTVAPVFVGHNLIDFDLRFIFQRAVMLGIKPPACIPFDAKPWDKSVFDTMTAWAGVRNRVSLDKLCKAFGIETPKDGIDGSKVWDYVKAGKIDEVAAYCARDVEATRKVYKRLTFAN